ncbi:hypothetical protein SARC_07343 [Sphaeroforma arctica JP610]|uniref:Uncharacterized protein n=1 Tax=Sphaeroforma arctica JP610 TaxID=667725 RepID=A0A0L0FTX6_9EUKA|nr:hypothetical protein SARC_07343 [Sphaeroforma arctica JP610]KNC80295.1 hypothetical protein SARC_07343 [Sphaeroforma arctica JP610]|eukprot:XP_014154197.1 hypothetical protein SARC_07343 [Sphaeroforma arctica JP610]
MGYDMSVTLAHFALQFNTVMFLVPRAPDYITPMDELRVPDLDAEVKEYDFTGFDRLARLLNKSPEQVQQLKDGFKKVRFDSNNTKMIKYVDAKLQLKEGAQPSRQISFRSGI